MANQTTVNLTGYADWFSSVQRMVMDKLDLTIGSDPILGLFTEVNDGSKATTLDTTGRANDGYARVKSPGGKAHLEAPVEEFPLSKQYITVAERENIEWEAFLHDKYNLVIDSTSELLEKVQNTFSLLLTHQLFNFGTATSVNLPSDSSGGASYDLRTPDGLALFSASHVVPGATGTFSNLGADLALSHANLTSVIGTMQQQTVTSKGNSMSVSPNCLIVPGYQPMVDVAAQITKSTQVSSSANNAINIYTGGMMDVIVLKKAPYDELGRFDTSKQFRWIVADKNLLKKALIYKWIQRPTAVGKFMDHENFDSSIMVGGRFAEAAQRWQGLHMVPSTQAPTTAA